MKPELDSASKVQAWLNQPEPAIFQGQDLRPYSSQIAEAGLEECVFLGCNMEEELAEAAAKAKCFIMPRRDDVVFDAFTPTVYTPEKLFDKLAEGGDWKDCLDYKIYERYYDIKKRTELPVDHDVVLLKRMHDASIADALDDFLDDEAKLKSVAIMGGHDVLRTHDDFANVARLAINLSKEGYTVVTGGGPGLMEAGNLGAYCAGFKDPEGTLNRVLAGIKNSPRYDSTNWLNDAYAAWKAIGNPDYPEKSRNVGIPTWYYGHEPPNLFATHIAKYFENSVREEGLLAIGQGGIVFAKGNGGTVQEIFQDANQNYYRTIGRLKSPMVLFGKETWNPASMDFDNPDDKRRMVYPVLKKLASEKKFLDYIFITDDETEVLKFIKEHPPIREPE